MGRTVEIPVSCPRCGTRPTVYVDDRFRSLLAYLQEHLEIDPEERTLTQRCPAEGCGRIYPIPIRALARSEATV